MSITRLPYNTNNIQAVVGLTIVSELCMCQAAEGNFSFVCQKHILDLFYIR